jgi:hypothetical protein
MNDADVEDAVLRVLHSAKITADLALCRFPALPATKLRPYTARGIPCVMVGTHGLELTHAVNERVVLRMCASWHACWRAPWYGCS